MTRREHDDLVEPLFGALRGGGGREPQPRSGARGVVMLLAVSALLLVWWVAR